MGKDVEFEIHPGTGHAFMNDENVLGTYDAGLAAYTWTGRPPRTSWRQQARPAQTPSARSIAGGISS